MFSVAEAALMIMRVCVVVVVVVMMMMMRSKAHAYYILHMCVLLCLLAKSGELARLPGGGSRREVQPNSRFSILAFRAPAPCISGSRFFFLVLLLFCPFPIAKYFKSIVSLLRIPPPLFSRFPPFQNSHLPLFPLPLPLPLPPPI